MQREMSEVNLSILIVNYNSHSHIRHCLDSIYKYSDNLNFEIHILDNHSSEAGFNEIENYPKDNIFTYISRKNMGFGAGINFLYRKAKGKFLLFLNPDTYFENNTIENLYSFADKCTDCGICSPAIFNRDRSLNYNFNYFPDFIWEIYELLGTGYNIRLKKLSAIINKSRENKTPIKVDWMTGACMLIRKDLFGAIGKFDERFFLYYEDVDLQSRLAKAGRHNYCLPYLEVFHESNVSSKTNREIYYSNLLRSKLLYYRKHFGLPKVVLYKIMLFAGYLVRNLIISFKGKRNNNYGNLKKRYKDSLNILMKN